LCEGSDKRVTMSKQERSVCVLLPNKEQLDITIGVKATGQDLFGRVCELLKVKNLHFFGLSVVKDNELVFMDLEQKLTKYFPKEWKKDSSKGSACPDLPLVTCLQVQYYIENGRLLSDRKARHLYYCDLRDRVLRSECRHKEEVYFLLAAYALQADLGDYHTEEHVGEYFKPQDYFPSWIIARRGCDYILKHAPKIHREQKGLLTKEAILLFVRESCLLEDVPVHFYRLRKDKKEKHGSIILGLTLRGMNIYQELNSVRQLLYDFPWSNVGRLTFLGKKFEIQPDGLPSARKLVYYTGSPFRSRHLLQHLSNGHRLYLNIQPVLKHIRKIEETEDKKRYRESYVSDTLEVDLETLGPGADSSTRFPRRSCSGSSCGSSGIEADARQRTSVEMTVDEPFSLPPTHSAMKSFSSAISHGSSHTSGIETGSKARTDDDWQDDEVELAVDEPEEVSVDDPEEMLQFLANQEQSWKDVSIQPVSSIETQVRLRNIDSLEQASKRKGRSCTDRHSQSLDDVRLFSPPAPLGAGLHTDTSQSYTFGLCAPDPEDQYCYTYCTTEGQTKPSFYGKRSMNCLSLDLLGNEQLLEFML
ncbi:FRMD6 protein, partial [Atractosteus spatula]|nr:FRMD6 protein [Atractosteus spatula]